MRTEISAGSDIDRFLHFKWRPNAEDKKREREGKESKKKKRSKYVHLRKKRLLLYLPMECSIIFTEHGDCKNLCKIFV